MVRQKQTSRGRDLAEETVHYPVLRQVGSINRADQTVAPLQQSLRQTNLTEVYPRCAVHLPLQGAPAEVPVQ